MTTTTTRNSLRSFKRLQNSAADLVVAAAVMPRQPHHNGVAVPAEDELLDRLLGVLELIFLQGHELVCAAGAQQGTALLWLYMSWVLGKPLVGDARTLSATETSL